MQSHCPVYAWACVPEQVHSHSHSRTASATAQQQPQLPPLVVAVGGCWLGQGGGFGPFGIKVKNRVLEQLGVKSFRDLG